MKKKLVKAATFLLVRFVAPWSPSRATRILVKFFRARGMRMGVGPTYVSSKSWLDGTDYSLIELGDNCLISSYVRILTHDWSPNTILRGLGYESPHPVGRTLPVSIGHGSFVGTGCVVMPGARIGDHCVIASGTVVRGSIPDFSIVMGSPGECVGDTRDYLAKRFPDQWAQVLPNVAAVNR